LTCSRKDVVDEDEQGLLVFELDSPPDDVDELAYTEVSRNQILFLVDFGKIAFLVLLDDDLNGFGGGHTG